MRLKTTVSKIDVGDGKIYELLASPAHRAIVDTPEIVLTESEENLFASLGAYDALDQMRAAIGARRSLFTVARDYNAAKEKLSSLAKSAIPGNGSSIKRDIDLTDKVTQAAFFQRSYLASAACERADRWLKSSMRASTAVLAVTQAVLHDKKVREIDISSCVEELKHELPKQKSIDKINEIGESQEESQALITEQPSL